MFLHLSSAGFNGNEYSKEYNDQVNNETNNKAKQQDFLLTGSYTKLMTHSSCDYEKVTSVLPDEHVQHDKHVYDKV